MQGRHTSSFNSQLLEEKSTSEDIVLDSQKSYSNRFHSSGGNAAYSVMANTLRGIYGADVLIAAGNSFTGNVLKAGYTEKMAGNMIMPNGLLAYSCKMRRSRTERDGQKLCRRLSREASFRLTVDRFQSSVVFRWRSGKQRMVIH